MKYTDLVTRRHHLLYRLSCLPAKIVAAHDHAHLAELVLYELSYKDCFNFNKAAFFVDNPDFNCLKGMAGINLEEHAGDDVWAEQEAFRVRMASSAFNNAVRAIAAGSINKTGGHHDANIMGLAEALAFKNPGWHVFKIKHGNIGVLVFDRDNEADAEVIKDHLEAGLSFLAFCPII